MDGKIGTFVRYSSRKDDSLYKSPANCFIRLENRKSDLQCFRDYIKNHSKNIIDLIEVGDYVNGDRMDIVDKDENGHVYYLQNIELPSVNKIETIVTKEQFAQAEYKIEEDK